MKGVQKTEKKETNFEKILIFFFTKPILGIIYELCQNLGYLRDPNLSGGDSVPPPRYKVGLKSYWQWHLSFFPIKVSWLVTQLYMLRYLFSITNTAVNIPCLRWICKIIQKISNISCIIYVSSLYFATRSFFSLRKPLKNCIFLILWHLPKILGVRRLQ